MIRTTSSYLPVLSREALEPVLCPGKEPALYEMLVMPLHEELYRRNDFNFLDDLSVGQQVLLSYDYIKNQVLQGGFIQLIQNGYLGLLPDMPEWLQHIGDRSMAELIDDVLKVYVLNHELMDKQTTPEEFIKLYEELKEFEILDARFRELDPQTESNLMEYARQHPEQFYRS